MISLSLFVQLCWFTHSLPGIHYQVNQLYRTIIITYNEDDVKVAGRLFTLPYHVSRRGRYRPNIPGMSQ